MQQPIEQSACVHKIAIQAGVDVETASALQQDKLLAICCELIVF